MAKGMAMVLVTLLAAFVGVLIVGVVAQAMISAAGEGVAASRAEGTPEPPPPTTKI